MFLVIAKRRIVFTKSHAKLKVDLQIKGGGKYFNFALFFLYFVSLLQGHKNKI